MVNLKWYSRRPHEYWVCETKKAQERLISYEIEKGESYMCLTVKEVKEILDGMRDDAIGFSR